MESSFHLLKKLLFTLKTKENNILIFIILCFCFCMHKTEAQNNSENKLGSWYMVDATHLVSKNLKLITNLHFRYFELASNYQQEIYRVGLNYSFHKNLKFTVGFVYSITDNSYKSSSPNNYEYRFYQDLIYLKMWKKIKVNHRIRLAQRFQRNMFDNSINHRIRYRFLLNKPLSKDLEIYAFNEIFVNFNSKLFDQNRLGGGFIKKINDNLKFKIGYFYNNFSESNFHRLQLGFHITTNQLKK